MSEYADRDDIPISIRRGEVVPPDDPEDWSQPLTWIAASGMIGAGLFATVWLWLLPPADAQPVAGTFGLAAAVAGGGVVTGLTQRGRARALAGTLAAALFAALTVVIAGTALAGERQVGAASPSVAHAFGAAVGGFAGAVAAAPLMAVFAEAPQRLRLAVIPAAIAIGVAALVVPLVL